MKPAGAPGRAAWPALGVAEAHARLTAPGSPYEMERATIRGLVLRTWKHLPASHRDVLLGARAHAQRTFLVHGDERVSFAAFHRAVYALAHDLAARGLRKGDRVAIAMRNLPEWPVAFYAATAVGAIVAPLNAWWSGAELAFGLADCGARFAIADAERAVRLRDQPGACEGLEALYVCGEFEPRELCGKATSLRAVIGAARDWLALPDAGLPEASLEPDDPAAIFYTSGTGGAPKGAVLTHRNMLSNIVGAQCAGARAALRRGAPPPAPDPHAQLAVLVTVPFFHVTGTCAVLSPALHEGQKLVLMHRWDVGQALRLIEREKVAAMVCVPTIAWQLAEHPALAQHDLGSLVSLGYGGASAPPELQRRIRANLPAAVPGHGWGMTETAGLTMTHSGEDYAHRPESCGAPLPVVDLRIMSLDGARELATGEIGELWVRGPNVAREYWNRPRDTAATFVDGWLRTGDLARLDADGFCFVVDRLKDIVIRGGENIYCAEVENALYEHPAVIDAAVVGHAHRTLGEVPVAFVHLAAGLEADEAQLQAHVAARLAAFKVPARIVFWPQALPRNANGKILKNEFKAGLA